MQDFAALFPLKWLTQGMRSVFLPAGFASQEVAHSWETARTAAILIIWMVAGILISLRTFKWSEK
jgi:ABC-2 type transport system permease protein